MIDAKLKKKLDEIVSKYVRLKYADKNGNCACYTCGKIKPWKEMQCGHLIKRNHTCTRWLLDNLRVQCAGCNVFGDGKFDEFAVKLEKEGIKLADLVKLKHSICKIDNKWIKESIEAYSQDVKILENGLENDQV